MMTKTVAPSAPAAPLPPADSLQHVQRRRRRGRGMIAPIMLQIAAMIGTAVLLYPTAANWFATQAQQSQISGYSKQIDALPSADRQRAFELAAAYNERLPAGVLRDPYTNSGADRDTEDTAAYAAYQDTLSVADNGVIGELQYSSLGIDLPIYHGTDDDVLAKGAGHLFGSSLPVGGASTHAVLTSHSGLPNASLFTPLHDAQIGDVFTVHVLGETHYYRVESTDVITPDETDRLRIVPGQDLMTLITCTPIGVNSHRLLVNAVRISSPADAAETQESRGGAGFPWWAVIFVSVSGIVAWLVFAPPRRRNHLSTRSGEAEPTTASAAQRSAQTLQTTDAITPRSNLGKDYHDTRN
ncbi:class C sortase [Pseudoclavibacter sp. 13-3]|uniref:class C sortase n=1 Tax=Pseudoclavibacter sp. 13-3 TaxID=2901228 RepID=UPI001E3BB89C|nr:class C sortase [Pseudoclavibacter sp. 13-3]MCD7101125.1 class C sortase [Pseudoclavibacter sp. 13-3]